MGITIQQWTQTSGGSGYAAALKLKGERLVLSYYNTADRSSDLIAENKQDLVNYLAYLERDIQRSLSSKFDAVCKSSLGLNFDKIIPIAVRASTDSRHVRFTVAVGSKRIPVGEYALNPNKDTTGRNRSVERIITGSDTWRIPKGFNWMPPASSTLVPFSRIDKWHISERTDDKGRTHRRKVQTIVNSAKNLYTSGPRILFPLRDSVKTYVTLRLQQGVIDFFDKYNGEWAESGEEMSDVSTGSGRDIPLPELELRGRMALFGGLIGAQKE